MSIHCQCKLFFTENQSQPLIVQLQKYNDILKLMIVVDYKRKISLY